MPFQPKDNRQGCVPNIGNGFGVAAFPKDIVGLAGSRAMRNSNRGEVVAQSDRQGTGRHPHESREKLDPHTKDNEGEGEGEHRSRSLHSSHSSGSERSSHSSRDNEWGRSLHGSQHGESSRSEHRGSEDADLREREYRDEQGNVHHHTRTYMEQHKGARKTSGTRSNARIKREPRRRLSSVCRRKAWPRSDWGPILWRHALGGHVQ
jgi:hypothetical protein